MINLKEGTRDVKSRVDKEQPSEMMLVIPEETDQVDQGEYINLKESHELSPNVLNTDEITQNKQDEID